MDIKKTSFWKAKELIRENKKKIFYIIGIDLLFFSVLLCLRWFLLKIGLAPAAIYNLNFLVIIAFTLSYTSFFILFYSLLKYLLLLILKSTKAKADFKIRDFIRFILLNIISWAVFFVIYSILSSLAFILIKSENLPVISRIILWIMGFLIYFHANIAQISFMLNGKIWQSVAGAFAIMFKRGKTYAPVIINIIIAAAIYFIISLPLVFTALQRSLAARQAYMVLAFLFLYILLFFNRIILFVKLANFK